MAILSDTWALSAAWPCISISDANRREKRWYAALCGDDVTDGRATG